MNICRLLCLASLVVAVGASTPALGQYQADALDPYAQQRFFAALRSITLAGGQHDLIRSIIGDGYLNGQSDREIDGRIAAVLDARALRTLQAQLGYDPGAPPPEFYARYSGVVHKIAGGSVTLTSGRTVFLRDATFFFPGRDLLKPGIRIGVDGQPAGNGNINADGVVTFDEGDAVGFDAGSVMAGGRFATVVATTKSNVRLADGTTVFLHDDTVFAPSRDALSPGARIVIFGVPAGNGNINADRIGVF